MSCGLDRPAFPAWTSAGARDEELIQLSAAYVAAALRTGRREEEQVEALLACRRIATRSIRRHPTSMGPRPGRVGLHRACSRAGPAPGRRRDGPIERWGGDKAGTRQAEALFAFLFDRGERGVAKDEVLELIWPDTDLERADLAFHRTMVGLRRTLDPGAAGGRT